MTVLKDGTVVIEHSETVVFTYTKANGEKSHRRVFLMNDCGTYIQGFDLSELTQDEANKLTHMLKGHEVRNNYGTQFNPSNPIKKIGSRKVDSDFIGAMVKKAWKTFKKEGVEYVNGRTKALSKKEVIEFLSFERPNTKKESINRYINMKLNCMCIVNNIYKKYNLIKFPDGRWMICGNTGV